MKQGQLFGFLLAGLLFLLALPHFAWETDLNARVEEVFIRIAFKLRNSKAVQREASKYLVIECPRIPIPETDESFYDIAGVLKKLQLLNPGVIIFDTDPGVSKDSPLQYWLTSLTFTEKMVLVSPEKGRNIATLFKRKLDYSLTNAIFALHQKQNFEVVYFKDWNQLPSVGSKAFDILTGSKASHREEPVPIHYFFDDEVIPHQDSGQLVQTPLPPCSFEGKIILLRTGSFSAFEKPFLTPVGIMKPETLLFNDIETRLKRPVEKACPRTLELLFLLLFLSVPAVFYFRYNVLKAFIFSLFVYELLFFTGYFLFQNGWTFHYLDFILYPLLFILAEGVSKVYALTRDQEGLKELQALKNNLVLMNKELAAKNKLSELGRLSASIYHEISNPLHNILNAVKSLKQEQNLSPEASETLEITVSEVERLQRLSKNLKQFYQPVSSEQKQTEVNEILLFALQMMKTTFSVKKIQITKEMKKTPLCVYANPDQLLQVFLNLLLNALDATGEAGKIVVETGMIESEIIVKIRDSGPGVSEEMRSSIFKAFFTTKGDKGSGLGLSVTYEIINSLGGDILLSQAQPGQGAEFVIHLPCIKK